MTPPPAPTRARLEELLGIEATQGLSPAEATELDALLVVFPDQDPDAFELAAAAVHLALLGPPEEMPAALAEKLYLTAVALAPSPAPPKRLQRPAWMAWSGWVIAAGLAGLLIYQLSKPPVEVVKLPPPEPTLEEVRDKIKKDPEYRAATFADTKGNASANVVWSDVKQVGVLEVRGLAANDPTKERYQLWIVDGKRKDEKPISAGLFDVTPGGPTLVRVNAAIPIGDAAVFAITKEQPSGVWITQKDMLLVMGPKAG